MVDSSRRRGRRSAVMGSHNRCWIWGRNVVQETLRAGRWPILELMISDTAEPAARSDLFAIADARQIPTLVVTESRLTELCRTGEHQGFAARMPPFPYLSAESLLATLPPEGCVAVLDRVQDPFNLGAIIRSAAALGIAGLVVGERAQADISSQVVRSSAGAVNQLPMARVASLTAFVENLKQRGMQILGASERATQCVFEADWTRATAILIGNEGRGIDPQLQEMCDALVQIPMSGSVSSLNAAVAASLFFYEMRRQRSLSPGRD